MPEFPKPPPPRTDLPAPGKASDSDWAAYLADLAEGGPPAAWITTDGTLYMRHMPAEMAPALGGPVDSSVTITPASPMYAKYARTVPIVYNYQGVEVPDAASTDGDTESG